MSSIWNWQPQAPACTLQPASLIRLEGADALRVLHGQTSAAIETAPPGRWIPTCCITATARLRALAEVLVDEGGAWLVVHAGEGAQVHSALDRVLFPADRVQLGGVETAWWLTPVAGLGEALEQGVEPAYEALADAKGWQLGGGRLGQALVLRHQAAGQAFEAWPETWRGRRILNGTELERWRLQQGLPAAPGELNDDHNPFEVGLAARVNLNKGCYLGQETLAKLATYDGVKQQLRRWHWSSTAPGRAPELGDELRPVIDPNEGTRLGRITSLLELDGGDRIGLAMVRRQALPEEQLQAGAGGEGSTVTLSRPAQFVDPPKGAGSTAGGAP